MLLSVSSDFFHVDNLLEDLPDTTSGKSTRPIGKFKEWKQASLLNINPSYGVLPRLLENTKGGVTNDDMYDVVQVHPKNVEETQGGTIKEVVYANDLPKRPENAGVTKGAIIESAVYDDIQIRPKHVKETQGGTIKEVIYANDPTAVVEEHEYL